MCAADFARKGQDIRGYLAEKVEKRLDPAAMPEDSELGEMIAQVMTEESRNICITAVEKAELSKELFHYFRGLDVLSPLLEDDSISEIMVNGYDKIFVEKEGRLQRCDKAFTSPERLENIIQQIVSGINRQVNARSPIADARLPDGSRVNIVLPPAALDGPVVTIRKFPFHAIGMEELICLGSITEEAAAFLEILVRAGYNIFISGGTGSGKTTFLNAVSSYIPSDERVITIEDSAELQLKGIQNLVRLEARSADMDGMLEITIRDLVRTALRARPDRLLIGEIRGPEALDLLQAMNTGHDGSISTGHANSAMDMLSRIETMVLMGMDLPLQAVRGQIASALDVMVHLGRLRDRTRKVLSIEEVTGLNEGVIGLRELYIFRESGEKNGKVEGKLERTEHLLENTAKLQAAGLQEQLRRMECRGIPALPVSGDYFDDCSHL